MGPRVWWKVRTGHHGKWGSEGGRDATDRRASSGLDSSTHNSLRLLAHGLRDDVEGLVCLGLGRLREARIRFSGEGGGVLRFVTGPPAITTEEPTFV